MNVQIDNTQSGADEDNKERLLRTLMQEEKAKRKEQSTEWNATLYAWGRGDVGLPEGEEEVAWEPRPLLSLSGLRPVSVSCSGKHSAMATSTGDIYTWGLNSSGQLGHGDMTDRSAPLVVKSLALVKVLQHTKFVQVATGEDHTVALTDFGAVYAWGGGKSGQLGVGDIVKYQCHPMLVMPLHAVRVIKVSCGSGYTACLTFDGTVYSWGRAANGRLGLGLGFGSDDAVTAPHRVKGLGRVRVSDIACGWSHSMCLTDDGFVYSWGRGQDGQLGHGDAAADVWEPKRIEFFASSGTVITALSCGYFHSAAVSEDGLLYTWGFGAGGRLGHGTPAQSELFPRLVEELTSARIVNVSCGKSHTLALDSLGFLHAFGTDEYGQLGVGKPSELGAESNGSNGNNNSNNAKQQYSITHPVFVGGLGEFNVVQVTCGFWSSLAVVEKVGNPRALAPSIISSVLSAATTTTTTTPGQPQQQQPSDEAGDATEISPAATPAAATTAITDDGLSTATAAASASAAGTASGISGISLEHGVQLGPDEGSPYVSSTRLGDETMMAPRLLSQESLVDSGLALPSLSLLMSSSSSALGDDGCLTAEESGGSSLENSGSGGSGTESGESDGDEDKGWRQRNFKLLSKVAEIFGTDNKETFSLRDERRAAESEAFWANEVVPHWERAREERKVREMIYLGVPAKMRGAVWSAAIGNSAGMSRDLFEIYVRHAREEMELNLEDGTGLLIEVDLPRTFPTLRFFDSTGPYHKDLMDVLAAWAQYRPDVGYVQGMTHLAGMFVMHMGTYEAFSCFVNVMQSGGLLLAFYMMDLDQILRRIKVYDALFRYNAPRLFARFQAMDVSPNYYLLDWFMTMFTRVLTVPQASRIWDVFFLEGEIVLYKAALGIVLLFEHDFMAAEFEDCLALLRKLSYRLEAIPENDIMASILSVKVPSNVKTSKRVPANTSATTITTTAAAAATATAVGGGAPSSSLGRQ